MATSTFIATMPATTYFTSTLLLLYFYFTTYNALEQDGNDDVHHNNAYDHRKGDDKHSNARMNFPNHPPLEVK